MQLQVGVMDSQRPPLLATMQVEVWSGGRRAWRGLWRLLAVAAVGVALIPVPLMHVCGAALAGLGAPIIAVLAWREHAQVEGGEVTCPKCAKPLVVPKNAKGWPVRVQCGPDCKATIELKPVVRA